MLWGTEMKAKQISIKCLFANRTEAKTSSDAWSGFLVLLVLEEEFDWSFSRRKPSEVKFCMARPSLG